MKFLWLIVSILNYLLLLYLSDRSGLECLFFNKIFSREYWHYLSWRLLLKKLNVYSLPMPKINA